MFDGKVSKLQQRRLLVYIDPMIKKHLQDAFYIDIDEIGGRLQACSIRRIGQDGGLGRECLRNSISLLLKFEFLETVFNSFPRCIFKKHGSYATLEQEIQCAFRKIFEYSNDIRLKTVALEFIKHVYALQNSMQSSKCLRLRNVLINKNLSRFQYSFNTDVASCRLKMASILY